MIKSDAFSFFSSQCECQLYKEHPRLTLDQINDRLVERQGEVRVSRPRVHQKEKRTLVNFADLEKKCSAESKRQITDGSQRNTKRESN